MPRYITKINDHEKIKRLMIHDSEGGVYLFVYDIENDGPACADYWCESLEDAFDMALEDYCVNPGAWTEIPDPQPLCQQDWIAPVRICGRETGRPQWGKLERWEAGKWVLIHQDPE